MITWSLGPYKRLLGNSSFRLFWSGFVLSVVGDSMTRVVLTWYVWETTGSPRALGLLTFLYLAPVLVGGLLAGWLLDRFGARRVMIIDNLLRGAAVATIPVLHIAGHLALWHVYAVAALYATTMMISLAGAPSMIPTLVPKESLNTANALETMGWTVSGVVGPPIAGLLIALIGGPNVIILDAASYVLFALALFRVREQIDSEDGATKVAVSYGLGDAFRLLLHSRVLLSTTAMYMAANFGIGMMFVWLPIYADQELGGGPGLYGLLLGLVAVGEMFSSVVSGSVSFPFSLGRLICVAQLLSGAALALVLLGEVVWITALGLALFGLFSAPLTIWAQTLRMRIIPPELRGRSFALLRTLMQGVNPIGGAFGGLMLPVAGIMAMIGLSSASIGLPGVLGYWVKELRDADA